jgi:hypothetical protein
MAAAAVREQGRYWLIIDGLSTNNLNLIVLCVFSEVDNILGQRSLASDEGWRSDVGRTDCRLVGRWCVSVVR